MPSKAWIFAALAVLGAAVSLGLAWRSYPPATPPASPLRISAAVSLRAVLEEARPILARAAGVPVEYNFASSGALAAQIMRGAPVDLFISADRADVETLAARGLVAPDGAAVVATNQLVLVVPLGAPTVKSLADLGRPQVHRIAVGDPASVPAGRYARETLERAGLWRELSAQGTLVMGENVAQVLGYVTAGEVDAGFVYRSDAQSAKSKVGIVLHVPASSHAPIEYVSAILKEAPRALTARAVQEALLGAPVQSILAAHGFGPVADGASPTTNPTPP
jgi:molybdate transport system substrate-binding protein